MDNVFACQTPLHLYNVLSWNIGCCRQVCVKENSSLQKDSNITMEIPPHTVLAYDIIELVVKSTGKYCEYLVAEELSLF